MEFAYVGKGEKPYSGKTVGIGGEEYEVIEEGSRQLIRGVPARTSSGDSADCLAAHGWFSTGFEENMAREADRDRIVNEAAKVAFENQAKEDKQRAFETKQRDLIGQFASNEISARALRDGLLELNVTYKGDLTLADINGVIERIEGKKREAQGE